MTGLEDRKVESDQKRDVGTTCPYPLHKGLPGLEVQVRIWTKWPASHYHRKRVRRRFPLDLLVSLNGGGGGRRYLVVISVHTRRGQGKERTERISLTEKYSLLLFLPFMATMAPGNMPTVGRPLGVPRTLKFGWRRSLTLVASITRAASMYRLASLSFVPMEADDSASITMRPRMYTSS